VSLVVIGVNHRTAPLELLERLTVSDGAVGKVLHALLTKEHLSEAVVLSTCNRTEVYAHAERFHEGYAAIRSVLSQLSHLAPEEITDHLYVHHDTGAVSHLFAVTAGLDSAVLGEHEIQGQVRRAWEQARDEDATGVALNLAFRHALEAGKRARTETAIGQHTASVSHAAVAMAADRLGGLEGRRVLVLGAGDMGESTAVALHEAGTADLVVANRTYETAVALAARLGGRAVRLSDVAPVIAEVDFVVSSTGASTIILSEDELGGVVEGRDRPLLIVDIAVPRDIDPAIGALPGVTLLDMDDLRTFAEAGVASRAREVEGVRAILAEEVERYLAASSAREVAPVVVAMRDAAETVRTSELDRFAGRLADLTPEQASAVEALTKGLVAKLLHEPSVALRDAAGTPKGDRLVLAIRDLFGIDPA
jgi:glutamyl-tRNA reductase